VAKLLRFKCGRCGYCCRHLLVDIEGGKGTIFLLPSETKLFPKELIKPLFGTGLKGRSRPRPAQFWSYQLNTNVCPHIKPDNNCAIYAKRPLICRAYPFEGGFGVIILHRECSTIAETIKEGEIVETIVAPEEKQANDILVNYVRQHAGSPLWHFDLKTQKWRIFPADKIRRRIGFG